MSYLDGVDFGDDLIGPTYDDLTEAVETIKKPVILKTKPRGNQAELVQAAINSGAQNLKDITSVEERFYSPRSAKRPVMLDRELFNMVLFLIVVIVLYLVMKNNNLEKLNSKLMLKLIERNNRLGNTQTT